MKSHSNAFTRVELAAVVTALAVVVLATLPTLATTRGDSQRVGCFNNLRQLGVAMFKYADENDGTFPPRSLPAWPEKLRPYYRQLSTLACPGDGPVPRSNGSGGTNAADAVPRSYLLNGWSDYYQGLPPPGSAFPQSAILQPSRTILFGEKVTESGHFWMDYWQGDDYFELEQDRHGGNGKPQSGGSNYTFADGSVQFLRWGESLQPEILWFVDPALRKVAF
jgi:prepilin-type processing-associated H-X9-DG protein